LAYGVRHTIETGQGRDTGIPHQLPKRVFTSGNAHTKSHCATYCTGEFTKLNFVRDSLPKMKILSTFTHPLAVSYLYDFLREDILKNVGNQQKHISKNIFVPQKSVSHTEVPDSIINS